MKKLLLMMLFGSVVLVANAQDPKFSKYDKYDVYYGVEKNANGEYVGGERFMVYIEEMAFLFDSDSRSEAEFDIKNYKKNGSVETFDLYATTGYYEGKKVYSVKLDLNPTKKTITIKGEMRNVNTEIKTDVELYGKKTFGANSSSPMGAVPNPKDEASKVKQGVNDVADGAKKIFNKGKDLFKKKN